MSAEQNTTEMPVAPAPQTSNGAADEGGSGYELDENGQRVSHGMGQSKSSRRRRRKRKGKGAEGSGSGESEAQSPDGSSHVVNSMEGVGTTESFSGESNGSQVSSDAQPASSGYQNPNTASSTQGGPRQNGGRSQQNNAGATSPANGAPGGTKRWKKKFRDRDRPGTGGSGQQNGAGQNGGSGMQQNAGGPQVNASGTSFRGADTHQPGNSTGGFKRKGGFGSGGGGGKQGRSGGGRSGGGGFVGPMDHSYRVVNGNVFEPGGATQSFSNGNGGGGGRGRGYQSDSQPIDYSQGRVIPIAEGTPTHIYFFIDDLFFTAKIQETARKLGVKVAFIKNEKEQIAQLVSGEDEDRPSLIVFDLNNVNAKPMTLIPKIKTKLKKTVSIIGFLSHLQGDLKAKAVEAGCDTVMPRAAFSQNLPNLLRRYGIEDTDETNYNQ